MKNFVLNGIAFKATNKKEAKALFKEFKKVGITRPNREQVSNDKLLREDYGNETHYFVDD